jgi:hypothetical protein
MGAILHPAGAVTASTASADAQPASPELFP